MSNAFIKVGPYTLAKDNKKTIYFYPIKAMMNEEVKKFSSGLRIVFEIESTRKENIFKLYTSLLNKEDEIVCRNYSIFIEEVEDYKYLIRENYPKEDIDYKNVDFKVLNYDAFIDLFATNKELAKLLPYLKEEVTKDKEDLADEKDVIEIIDIPSRANYYQNVTGYVIDEIEKMITAESDLELNKKILKNVKKSHDLVLYRKDLVDLSVLSIYGSIIDSYKSNNVNPIINFDSRELKTDTDKVSLKLDELDSILDSFMGIKEISDEEINMVQERIEYELTSKPKLSEFKNHLKIIFVDDRYLDDTRRVRSVSDKVIKEIIAKALANNTYRPLPRNEVLLYILEEDKKTINACVIVSQDKILQALKSFTINYKDDLKDKIKLLDTLESYLKNGKVKDFTKYLKVLNFILLKMLLYYSENASKVSLIDKGDIIFKVDYVNGKFDISIYDSVNKKNIGSINRITDELSDDIKKALDKNEKNFKELLNKVVLNNIELAVNSLNVDININEVNHNDIKIVINKSNKDNYLKLDINIGAFLLLVSSVKVRDKKVKKVETIIEDETITNSEYIYNIYREDYDFIIRKAIMVSDLVKEGKINTKKYQQIEKLYEQFLETETSSEKEKIILELSDLLDVSNVRLFENY